MLTKKHDDTIVNNVTSLTSIFRKIDVNMIELTLIFTKNRC